MTLPRIGPAWAERSALLVDGHDPGDVAAGTGAATGAVSDAVADFDDGLGRRRQPVVAPR